MLYWFICTALSALAVAEKLPLASIMDESLAIMSQEDSAAVFADDPDDEHSSSAILASCSGGSRRAAKKTEGPLAASQVCWLCSEELMPTEAVKHRGQMMHQDCRLCCRKHERLCPPRSSARTADDKLLKDDPDQWKANVLAIKGLDGRKDRGAFADHKACIPEVFEEKLVDKSGLWLPKRRFIAFK